MNAKNGKSSMDAGDLTVNDGGVLIVNTDTTINRLTLNGGATGGRLSGTSTLTLTSNGTALTLDDNATIDTDVTVALVGDHATLAYIGTTDNATINGELQFLFSNKLIDINDGAAETDLQINGSISTGEDPLLGFSKFGGGTADIWGNQMVTGAYRIEPALLTQSAFASFASSSSASSQTSGSNTSTLVSAGNWYRISAVEAFTRCEAAWHTTGSLSTSGQWYQALDWESVAKQSLTGSLTVTETGQTYSFPGYSFAIGESGALKKKYTNDLPDSSEKIIVFEDGGGWDMDDFYCKLTVDEFDLQIDSNNDGQITAEDDPVEDIFDDPDHPGNLIQSNSEYDADKDGISDFADGYNLNGTSGDDDDFDAGLNLSSLNLLLPSHLPATAKVKIEYVESNPLQTRRGDDGSYNLAPGLRLWWGAKSPVFGLLAYYGPREYTPEQLPIASDGKTLQFYVEGVGLSTQWGDQQIKVSVDVNGDGSYDISDAVRITLVDTRLCVYVVQPYTVQDGFKVFTPVDYTSPATMRNSAVTGFFNSDTDGTDTGWHGKGSWFGHAFGQLYYCVPGHVQRELFGSTGQEQDQFLLTLKSSLWGDVAWQYFTGHRNSDEDLAPWIDNNNKIHQYYTPATDTTPAQLGPLIPLVLDHTWVIKPDVAKSLNKLLQPVSGEYEYGRDYNYYGLDIATTQGGCATLLGVAMGAVGMTDAYNWLINVIAPKNILVDQSHWFDPESVDNDINDYQLLTFYDTGLMSEWMLDNSQNSGFTYYYEKSTWNNTYVWPVIKRTA
jgi:hypothetical protein